MYRKKIEWKFAARSRASTVVKVSSAGPREGICLPKCECDNRIICCNRNDTNVLASNFFPAANLAVVKAEVERIKLAKVHFYRILIS
ncbi:hypothetical protein U1Q18_051322, partial [Sarracenia purpurea var. burkii]